MAEDIPIQALTLAEAIRKRPYMYFGADNDDVHYRMLWEFLCIAREQACRRDDIKLTVTLLTDARCKVEFTGAFPVSTNVRGIPFAQLIMTELHACKYLKPADKQEFCTVGIAVANAACSDLDLVILTPDQKRYFQFYSKGIPTSELERSKLSPEADWDTTIFKFRIDSSLFPKREYDYKKVVEWSEMNLRNIQTTIIDMRTGKKTSFKKGYCHE